MTLLIISLERKLKLGTLVSPLGACGGRYDRDFHTVHPIVSLAI
jgi:hypothetical protein